MKTIIYEYVRESKYALTGTIIVMQEFNLPEPIKDVGILLSVEYLINKLIPKDFVVRIMKDGQSLSITNHEKFEIEVERIDRNFHIERIIYKGDLK